MSLTLWYPLPYVLCTRLLGLLQIAWIYQIILSEFLGVPVTIESGDGERNGKASFYDPVARFIFPDQVYPAEHLVVADELDGKCSQTDKPCAHVLPDIWSNDYTVMQAQKAGQILLAKHNGLLGDVGYYIPKHTAKRDASLTSFYGLQGEDNREKVASTFKTPTTWDHYCSKLSETNCTNDPVARGGFPPSKEAGQKYYVTGAFDGHFRVANENNCSITDAEGRPKCVGHVVAPSCVLWLAYISRKSISLE